MTEVLDLRPGDGRLRAVYPVMRELRPDLTEEEFNAIYAAEHPHGFRVAAVFDGDECRATAGYRLMTNFVSGRYLYVDDLVTAEAWRSKGYGRLLNEFLIGVAEREGCGSVQLDSNVRRQNAHRFYFRERYVVTAFHFGRLVRA